MTAGRAVYEIRIDTGEGDDEALAMQEPLARVVCPDPWHAPPCDVRRYRAGAQDAATDAQLMIVPMCSPELMAAAAPAWSMSKTCKGSRWSRARMKALWSITPKPRSITSW